MNMQGNSFSEKNLSENFAAFCELFFSALQKGEHARISLAAEETHFLRMSRGAVRQNGMVQDAQFVLQFMTAEGCAS